MITSNIAFYPTVSIEKTEKFYTEVIGLSKVFGNDSFVVFDCVKGHFGFVLTDDESKIPKGLCLSLNCDSEEAVDSEYKRVLALGADTIAPPKKHDKFPVYSFFINEPNGYLLEFQKIENILI